MSLQDLLGLEARFLRRHSFAQQLPGVTKVPRG